MEAKNKKKKKKKDGTCVFNLVNELFVIVSNFHKNVEE